MRIFVLVFVLAAFCSCDDKITQEDLEGTWESTDTAWAKMQYIFKGEHFRVHYPSNDTGIVAHLMDSMSMEGPTNLYRYKLDKDTIKYDYELKFILEADSALPKYVFKLLIRKLESDSLKLEEPGSQMIINFARI